MQLAAVLLARVLGLVETYDLNPRGVTFGPDLMAGIVQRFKFQKFPQKLDEMDEQKGIEFLEGTWNGINVMRLTIYSGAINIDTRSSTDDSKRIIHEALAWASEKFKLHYRPDMIKRWRYLSQITLYSDVPILGGEDDPTAALLNRISKSVEQIIEQPFSHHPVRLDIDFPRFERSLPIAPFTLQRRTDVPYSENKYFSEAPLPTSLHYSLLEQYESDLLAASTTTK